MTDSSVQVGIRAARAEDAASIAGVQTDSWRSTYAGVVPDEVLLNLGRTLQDSRRWRHVLGRFRRNHFVYVAENGCGDVVGFASAGPSRCPALPYRAEVYAIYLRDEYHGCGIGRELFATAAAEVGKVRGPSLLVWCLDANPSRYFYERMNGVLVARRPSGIGGARFEELGYAWNDVAPLAAWSRA